MSTAFVPPSFSSVPKNTALHAGAPARLQENADGVLYVNDKCINCAACSHFAPSVFQRGNGYHIVSKQPNPTDIEELDSTRAALSACPVAAIRLETTSAKPNHHHHNDDHHQLARKLSLRRPRRKTSASSTPATEDEEEDQEWVEPFPRPLLEPKYNIPVDFIGHHNEKTFGATPYLAIGNNHNGEQVSVMIDTPKYNPSAVRAISSSLTKNTETTTTTTKTTVVDYHFLTHVDDTAGHNQWKNHYPHIKRIFHSGDLGRHNWVGDLTLEHVEVLLLHETQKSDSSNKDEKEKEEEEISLVTWNLDGERIYLDWNTILDPSSSSKTEEEEGFLLEDGSNVGDFVILHTPGHSPGSISLLYRTSSSSSSSSIGILFTGDTYAYSTRDGGAMTGFPRYGNNLSLQAQTLKQLGKISNAWDIIAPGHGHKRDYSFLLSDEKKKERKLLEMEVAIENLRK